MSQNKLVFLMFLLIFTAVGSIDVIVAPLPQIAMELHITTHISSYLITFYSVGLAVSMLLTGQFCSKFGIKKTLLSGFLLYTISSLALIFSFELKALLFFRFLQSIGGSCGIVIVRLLVKDNIPQDHQLKALNKITLANALAPALSPVVGLFIAKNFGWHYVFLLCAILGSYLLYTIKYKLHDDSANHIRQTRLHDYIMIMKNRQFLRYTFIITFIWSSYFTFLTISSYIFEVYYNLSGYKYAAIMILVSFAYLMGNLFVRTISKKGPSKVLKIGIYICVLSFILFSLSIAFHQYLIVIAAALLLRISVSIILPSTQLLVVNSVPRDLASISTGTCFFIEYSVTALWASLATVFSNSLYINAITMILIAVLFTIIAGSMRVK